MKGNLTSENAEKFSTLTYTLDEKLQTSHVWENFLG